MDIRISKSLYIRGLQCIKALYLEKHHRELKTISENAQGLFDNGHLVGETARGLFPGGVMIPHIPGEEGQNEQVRLTQEVIATGASIIFEGATRRYSFPTRKGTSCRSHPSMATRN